MVFDEGELKRYAGQFDAYEGRIDAYYWSAPAGKQRRVRASYPLWLEVHVLYLPVDDVQTPAQTSVVMPCCLTPRPC